MDQEPVAADPIDTTAKTVTDTSAKVKDGAVTIESKKEDVTNDPPVQNKVSVKITKDGMVMLEPVIDKQ
jgi:hypothetical protein